MLQKLLHLFSLHTTNGYQEGYDAGYVKGIDEGSDLGKRIAYNQTLRHEIPRILSRYNQLQVKLMTKPKDEVQTAYEAFQDEEIKRFEMEMQER